MCRFTLYLGSRIRLDSLILEPEHSLIRQSSHSSEREEPLNGDGFGIGWYERQFTPEPAVFRSITPAWNNRNLHNLSRVVASDCILAHVRAATRTSSVNEANCHPFRFRQFLLMHNGDVGGFERVRRRMLASVCDDAFGNVYGSTDSEHFFAIFIDEILKGPVADDPGAQLADAMDRSIRRVVDLVSEFGGGAPSYLNIAVTDGDNAVISRFTNAEGVPPESLYFFTGDLYPLVSEKRDPTAQAPVIASSERLTPDPSWEAIPPNHMLLVRRHRRPELRKCSA